MRNIEARIRRLQDEDPLMSTLVILGRAVEHQRLNRSELGNLLMKFVDKGDYEESDIEGILDHLLGLSHSPKIRLKI